MGAKPGYGATFTVGGTAIKAITGIDHSSKTNMDETTSFSMTVPGTESNIPTTHAPTSVKLSGKRDSASTAQNALKTARINRTTVTGVFDPVGDAVETHTATYWVTDWGLKVEPKKAVQLEITLMADGSETWT